MKYAQDQYAQSRYAQSRYALGQAVPRAEDPRLLRGGGRYTDDINAPGQAHSLIVRSPHAHARIKYIDTVQALRAPGVLAVFTGADIAASKLGDLPTFAPQLVPLTRPDGAPIYVPPHPALAPDTVRFVGDPVAFVVAETALQARDAAELIVIDYQILEANTHTGTATRAVAVWPECEDNICFRFQIGDEEAVNAAIDEAAHVTHARLPISRLAVNAMEPRAAIGEYDPYDERYTLTSGNQFPHDIRGWLARYVLGVPDSAVRIISPDMGGSFGLRSNIFPELALTLWAAKELARPIKWLSERSEALMEEHARDIILAADLALDSAGHFLGLRVSGTANLGAYLSIFGPLPAFGNIGGVAGTYKTPAIHAAITAAFSHTAPVHPYRGAGRPEATLLIEHVIDKAALELNMDRAELRQKNLIRAQDMPYQTPLTYHYDCGDFEANMRQALANADYAGLSARRAAAAAAGKLLGFGIANAVEQAAGMFDEGAEIRIDATGVATILSGVHSHGQGHATVFRQLVAGRLGLDFSAIRFVQGDTDHVAYGHGTGGSRASGLAGSALHKAAQRIIEKGKQIAAHVLEAAALDIEFTDGEFIVAGTDRRLSLQDIAKTAHTVRALPPGMDSGLTGFATFTPPGPTFPNACHTCEVLIDTETGAMDIVRYVAVEDVGTVMNPLLLEGQIHGGIAQGLGQVICEAIVFDESGQLNSGTFMDYAMPRADQFAAMEVSSNPVPTARNPLGVKGAGEAGTVGALAAGMSAVHDALAQAGVRDFTMPATPNRLWHVLNKR
ncbi:MAG: molybdopterin-dependent oxidoreductase [Gammaproteobacteria bacterium]|nr:molybdopterin-dependent oxidoreductase [Gammaproteobacteria bacterium]